MRCLALAAWFGMIGGAAADEVVARGSIDGVVKDAATGAPLADATVVATSPALEGSASALTEEDGSFSLDDLPPGTYQVAVYYGCHKVRRGGVVVTSGTATSVHVMVDVVVDPWTRHGGARSRAYLGVLGRPRRSYAIESVLEWTSARHAPPPIVNASGGARGVRLDGAVLRLLP